MAKRAFDFGADFSSFFSSLFSSFFDSVLFELADSFVELVSRTSYVSSDFLAFAGNIRGALRSIGFFKSPSLTTLRGL